MSEQRARLLIVDDDVDLRTTLPMILAGVGYRVRSADDGFSALTEIRTEMPDTSAVIERVSKAISLGPCGNSPKLTETSPLRSGVTPSVRRTNCRS